MCVRVVLCCVCARVRACVCESAPVSVCASVCPCLAFRVFAQFVVQSD